MFLQGHAPIIGGAVVRYTADLPYELTVAILRGFRGTVLRKDFPRIVRLSKALDARIRGLGLQAPEEMVDLLQWCDSQMSETSTGASVASSDPKEAYVWPHATLC